MNQAVQRYDVVIVGGGAAGLSAAVTLGRARRSVLVVDAGEPRNAPAAGVHGFLSRDGLSPLELVRLGRAEAESYGAVFVDGTAVAAERVAGAAGAAGGAGALANKFVVTLEDGSTVQARRLLIATGLVDELPPIDGVRERWGTDVLHCPYCHGWEVRDQHIGVIGSGPMAVHRALLWRQWSPHITLFLHDSPDPEPLEWEQLAALDICVIDGRIASLAVENDALTGIVMQSGKTFKVDAAVVGTRMSARTALLESLGAEVTEHPLGVGSYVDADPMTGATSVPGVWTAGNVTDIMAQVVLAAAEGVRAGAAINMDLITADTASAVEARRARAQPPFSNPPFSAEAERANHERLTGAAQHGITPPAGAHQHGGHQHGDHQHGDAGDAPAEYDQAFWDARYAESESIWSGNPNPVLVAEASTLSSGTGTGTGTSSGSGSASGSRSVLDVGSGEGADAIWLAERGWRVTAVDISPVALARAADRAAAHGVAADRITWEQHDLTAWAPPAARFDLVSAQFMHLPQTQREVLFRDLAAAVADGGTLLIVGHDMADLDVGNRWRIPGMFYSAEELAATLDPALWVIVVAKSRARPTIAEGETVTVRDVVLRAERRRSS